MVLLARAAILLTSCAMLNNLRLCEGGDINDDSDSDADRILRDALLLIHVIRTGEALNASAMAELLSSYQNTISVAAPSSPRDLFNISEFSDAFSPTQHAERRSNIVKHDDRAIRPERRDSHYRRQYDHKDRSSDSDSSTATSTVAASTTLTSNEKSTAEIVAATIASETTPTLSMASTSQSFRKTTKIAKTLKNVRHFIASKKQELRMAKQSHTQNGTQQTKKGSESQANDPIIFQVKSELENELRGISAKKSEKILLKVKGPESAGSTKVPSTLRIHLKSSSRYPIPFPENHALCYTNPKNGLCRSPI